MPSPLQPQGVLSSLRVTTNTFASRQVCLLLLFLLVTDLVLCMLLDVKECLSGGPPYRPGEAADGRFEAFVEDLAYWITDD